MAQLDRRFIPTTRSGTIVEAGSLRTATRTRRRDRIIVEYETKGNTGGIIEGSHNSESKNIYLRGKNMSEVHRDSPTVRNSADNVSAAYRMKPRQHLEDGSCTKKTGYNTSSLSVTRIGCLDSGGSTGDHHRAMEKLHLRRYMRAVEEAREVDKSYIAEAAHFRFKYPHTLGRINSLSHARVDRSRNCPN